MSAMQPPTPNHQSETFGSPQTQFFECDALSADHPEIQVRERARPQHCAFQMNSRDLAGWPTWDSNPQSSAGVCW